MRSSTIAILLVFCGGAVGGCGAELSRQDAKQQIQSADSKKELLADFGGFDPKLMGDTGDCLRSLGFMEEFDQTNAFGEPVGGKGVRLAADKVQPYVVKTQVGGYALSPKTIYTIKMCERVYGDVAPIIQRSDTMREVEIEYWHENMNPIGKCFPNICSTEHRKLRVAFVKTDSGWKIDSGWQGLTE